MINEAVIFKNDGVLDLSCIKTFGVSVKVTDNPIGYFGTGLKHAIAVLVRRGHAVKIVTGGEEYRFSSTTRTMRGKDFDIVTMNGQDLGFTTDLGKNWEMWQVYREIYCNCQDEINPEIYTQSVDKISCENDTSTYVIVAGEGFYTQHINRHDVIFDAEIHSDVLISKTEFVDVYHTSVSSPIYYRGIKVSEFGGANRFKYNIKQTMTLTEDRTLMYNFELSNVLVDMLKNTASEEVIDAFILHNDYADTNQINHRLDEAKSNKLLIERIEQNINKNRALLKQEALRLLSHESRRKLAPQSYSTSEIEEKQLAKAIEFLKTLDFHVDEFPIICTDVLSGNIMGMAEDGNIYISKLAFVKGTKYVASTVLEEFIHLKYGYDDCTYNMQTFLFDNVISMGERLIGDPL